MLVENGAASGGGKRAAADGAGGGGKRRRSSGLGGGTASAFEDLLEEGGCCLVSGRDGSEFEVDDPRKLRRVLEQRLTLNANLRAAFLKDVAKQLGEDTGVLHAALRPMEVTGNVPATGDSFVRVLLNVTALQAEVARMLLHLLPQFEGASGEEAPIPQLILGQFRWLDYVADPSALTERLIEVLSCIPEHVKAEAITFLPEVALEDNYEAVIEALAGMMREGKAFILPSIDALANLCLDADQQSRVVELVLGRFQAAEAEDLPSVIRFLLQYAAPGSELKKVVTTLRESLHFVSPTDPRLAVPDRKGKAAVPGDSEHPELKLLEALKQAMQLSKAAADAVVKEVRGLTEPGSHRILDFWLLLVMLTLGADRRKAAEATLKRKFSEGHAQPAWLRRGIEGHERVMLKFFPQLLSLAQQLLRHAGEEVRQAGEQLYCCLFKSFTEPYNQQEVLRALHSHLGAQVPAEASAALGVLVQLARQHTAALMGYAAFLTNILDYVDAYTDQQVHQVFVVFGELVAGACHQADEGSSAGGRSRMEDELMIFVRKQLASAHGRHRRVGIIGAVALVQRLGAAESSALEGETSIGARYKEAMGALKDTFDSCKASPEAFAFLCDELARGVQRRAIGRKLVDDLHELISNHLEETFFCFLEEGDGPPAARLALADQRAQVGGQRMTAELWWNLDGELTPVALKVLPLLAEELTPGSKSATLLSLFANLRLTCALEHERSGGLAVLSALLGCPFNLFPQALADPQQFRQLSPDLRCCVLLGVWYALNWCRELANCFGRELSACGEGDQSMVLKLFARLRCCCQLEALLDTLLQYAPPLFTLPPLGSVLADASDGLAPAAAAAPKKAAAKSGGGKVGRKKKGVTFEGGDASSGGAAGGGSNRGSGSQPSSPGRTTSGGTAGNNAGGAAATQAVQAAVSGGLGRLAAERWKQRTLLLPALATLGVGAAALQQEACYAMLPTAAYLLADLHGKLKAVLTAGSKRGFPGRAPKKQLPADLAELAPAELLATVAPLLPCIRRHLDAACNVFDQSLSEQEMEEHDRDNFWSVVAATGTQMSGGEARELQQLLSCCLVPLDSSAARAALSATNAALRVRTLALDCILQLVQWPGLTEPANRPVLHALLAAFQNEGPQEVPADGDDLTPFIKTCFSQFSAQLPKMGQDSEPTTESLSHQHASLLIMDALAGLLRKTLGECEMLNKPVQSLQAKMSKRILKGAESVLRQSTVDEKGEEAGSAVWRSRGPLLADLLRLHIAHHARGGSPGTEAVQAVQDLTERLLAKVPDLAGKPGKDLTTTRKQELTAQRNEQAARPVGEFPSLCGNTVAVWYRVCFEQLQAAWEAMVASAVGAERDEAVMTDVEALQPILDGMQAAAGAFAGLLKIVKKQTNRVAIHVQAVKSGGKFLEALLRALPFWGKLFKGHSQEFEAMIKQVQVGTKVLQSLCNEGKYKKEMPVTAKVPALKKSVERFVFSVKVMLEQANAGRAFTLGTLKHKDLNGKVVNSQMYNEEDEAAEEEEEEEEEEEADEEEEDEGTGESQMPTRVY